MNVEEIPAKIISLKEADLVLRNQLIQSGQLGDGYHEDMAKLHNENADSLNDIIKQIGYPTIDKVGEDASVAAWLVIQHAIGQPSFMKQCAAQLQIAVEQNLADPIQLAYLSDRIAVFEDQQQLYGTQFDWDANGEMMPNDYDDLAKVNQRRKQLGLNTLEEQTAIIQERAKIENQQPPKDAEERKRAYNNWRKAVGWIE